MQAIVVVWCLVREGGVCRNDDQHARRGEHEQTFFAFLANQPRQTDSKRRQLIGRDAPAETGGKSAIETEISRGFRDPNPIGNLGFFEPHFSRRFTGRRFREIARLKERKATFCGTRNRPIHCRSSISPATWKSCSNRFRGEARFSRPGWHEKSPTRAKRFRRENVTASPYGRKRTGKNLPSWQNRGRRACKTTARRDRAGIPANTPHTTPILNNKMACIASTFTGSVAALKASKVQVRRATRARALSRASPAWEVDVGKLRFPEASRRFRRRASSGADAFGVSRA